MFLEVEEGGQDRDEEAEKVLFNQIPECKIIKIGW